MKISTLVALGLLMACPSLAAPPGARLVKDVNPSTSTVPSVAPYGAWFTRMGDAVYFSMEDGIHGTELWRSDGTTQGTHLVKDLCPGTCPSIPIYLTAVGDSLFFVAQSADLGRELWHSDGTAQGTAVVRDLVPGLAGSNPRFLAAGDGVLYFSAVTPETGRELWTSDGTAAGTALVKDVWPGPEGSWPEKVQVLDGIAYFAADDGVHGKELWRSDGTAAGTSMVKDIWPGAESSGGGLNGNTVRPAYQPLPGGVFLFTASDGTHGHELWKSDGTAEGTALVKDIFVGPSSSRGRYLTAVGGEVFFSARGTSSNAELWKSDGTAAGTVLVQEIRPGDDGSFPGNLTALGSTLFFDANDGVHGQELWVSDGTEGGTTMVKDIYPGANSSQGYPALQWGLLPFNDQLMMFYADDGTTGFEPWISDGTEAGTTLLKDVSPGAFGSFIGSWTNGDGAAEINGKLLVRLFSLEGYDELWATDGTPEGTQLVLDLATQTSSVIYSALNGKTFRPGAPLGNALIYPAFDGANGEEPWVSDGTEAGTHLLASISSNLWGSRPGAFVPIPGIETPGRVIFRAARTDSLDEIWTTDGTPSGTHRVVAPSEEGGVSTVHDFTGVHLNGDLLFTGESLDTGREVWATNGTEAGTRLVKDIQPGAESSYPGNFKEFAGRVYFTACSEADNCEPWSTDGTASGTELLADLNPEGFSSFLPLAVVDDRLFFAANDGTTGSELWALDEPGAPPRLVRDIRPGPESTLPIYLPELPFHATLNGILYFLADDGTSGEELWRSDGTEAGTYIVVDLVPGAGSPEPQWLTATDNAIYFVANVHLAAGTAGRELWKSDGTAKGTKLVMDLAPGSESSVPIGLTAIRSTLYFSAYQPATGRELWRTTAAGAELVADIAPGPLSSSPLALRRTGAYLLFAANDHTHGFELWAVAPEELFEDGFESGNTSRWSLTQP